MKSTKWYASWFDTPYYEILYKDRDHKEAAAFMGTLTQYLGLHPKQTILDLACGKGRHSIHLNKLGYNVTGIDLSKNSIAHASQFKNENLRFAIHDMSKPYSQQFDAVFNLFTSFGYFENETDNLNTVKAISANLKPHGLGVIDFMNVDYVLNTLVFEEIKIVNAIEFNIKRYVKDGYIHKNIQFTDRGKAFSFTEKVKIITLNDINSYLTHANLKLLEIFGDYTLNKYNATTSPRLISIFTPC